MATRRKSTVEVSDKSHKTRRPATTPEARENQLIAQAMDHVEKQIEDGTVSSQVLTHFLKLGSSRERLEQERLAQENDMLAAKTEIMKSAKRVEELYSEALNAMRSYSGQEPLRTEIDVED